MKPHLPKDFEQNYQTHLKRLRLHGMQPKTIEAYSRAVRRAGEYFEYQIDALTEQQLTGYFSDLLESHSWSTVKHDLYGLKFYYAHVLHKPWVAPGLIKPPRAQQLPDIVTVERVRLDCDREASHNLTLLVRARFNYGERNGKNIWAFGQIAHECGGGIRGGNTGPGLALQYYAFVVSSRFLIALLTVE